MINLQLLALVLEAHGGQTREGCREDGRPDPQVEHVMRVWLQAQKEGHVEVSNVVLAHDILEDCPHISKARLYSYLTDEEWAAVKLMTHKKASVPYSAYLKKLYQNKLARFAKLYDAMDNSVHAALRWRPKYDLVIRYLTSGDEERLQAIDEWECEFKPGQDSQEDSVRDVVVESDLMWSCHICGAHRPDNRISVFKRDISKHWDLPEGAAMHNTRYCNDNDACCDAAQHHKHFDYDGKDTTSKPVGSAG